MLKTKSEKERGYSDKTHKLILAIEKVNLSKTLKLDKKKCEGAIRKAYKIAGLPLTEISWKEKIDEEFIRAAGAAWAAGVDYDFDCFIDEFEYTQHENGRENDKKALTIYEQFWIARQNGLGYITEQNGKAILVPAPVVYFEKNRFHSLTHPAITWKGEEHYFIHGVELPKDLWEKIAKHKLSAAEVFAIENTEHRRVAYEIMDKVKMKELPDLKVEDELKDDGYGYPMKVISFKSDKYETPFYFLNCFCPSTGREYFIETRLTKCWEAKMGSFGLEAKERFGEEY